MRILPVVAAVTAAFLVVACSSPTEEKLKRDGVNSKQQANTTHFDVGRKVRQTIQELGGTMPEELPTPQISIKQLENSVKITEKK